MFTFIISNPFQWVKIYQWPLSTISQHEIQIKIRSGFVHELEATTLLLSYLHIDIAINTVDLQKLSLEKRILFLFSWVFLLRYKEQCYNISRTQLYKERQQFILHKSMRKKSCLQKVWKTPGAKNNKTDTTHDLTVPQYCSLQDPHRRHWQYHLGLSAHWSSKGHKRKWDYHANVCF